MSDKELVSRKYKEYLQLNNEKTNDLIFKWAKDLNRYFSQEYILMTNKHMKRCPTSLVIREINANQNTMMGLRRWFSG